MGLLTNFIARVRGDARLLRVPPYLSLLCMLGGIVWILLLPLQQYSRQTYISENALLPGQVHTYFGGSEHNIFRAYRHEVARVIVAPWTHDENGTRIDLPVQATDNERGDKFVQLLKNTGLKVGRQAYRYYSNGKKHEGENIYGVLHAPRGDGTEAIVLVAPVRNIKGEVNLNGVTLLVSLAKYMKKWSLWSKDIIFLITPDTAAGPQAWVDAYHSQHDSRFVEGLPLKSGALQGVVAIDYAMQDRFENFHIAYDGINGQLPNLDLFNTATTIASGQMGVGISIQGQHSYSSHGNQHEWPKRVLTMGRGMVSQALGHATGAHSVFMPYHIDAITLTAIGQGWQDEMAFGRTVESVCRSLNNLLEKLHQSFFFYLLMQSNRFVSIGTYLPSAMAVAAAYTVMAIYLWIMSGYQVAAVPNKAPEAPKADGDVKKETIETTESAASTEKPNPTTTQAIKFVAIERDLTMPITILTALHLTSLFPVLVLARIHYSALLETFALMVILSLFIPFGLATLLVDLPKTNTKISIFTQLAPEQYVAVKSLSLLVLGLFLTVLATLNFSLSMFLGILCAPLAFVDRTPGKPAFAALQYLVLAIFSPASASIGFIAYNKFALGQAHIMESLLQLGFGWNVWGSWGILVGVVCIWWPAWTIGAMLVASSWLGQEVNSKLDRKGLQKIVDQMRKEKQEELAMLNGPPTQ